MKKILFIISVLSFASAQEILIYGHVYSSILVDNEMNPISNAQVSIGMDSIPEGILTFTNEEGYYELIFDWNWDGPIPIVCDADNYNFFIATIMPNDIQIEFDIQLSPINSNEECTEEECGPPPMMPNYLCFDGITIAGPGDCIEAASGECLWEIIECPTILGYLREIETSVCQDECSQYIIESEAYEFPNINVIPQNPSINIDLYLNRFIEVDLVQEITCAECSAFEVSEINLSENCNFPVDCYQDPCITYECEINPDLICIPHFCGGCYADFYDLDGNLVDCYNSIDECEGPNPAGCFQNGCSEGYECIDDPNNCVSSFCFCDEEWTCTGDCNGGTCFPIQTLGDINNDSEVNVLDIVLIVHFILIIDQPTEAEFYAGDINSDGQLNVLDVVAIVQIILNSLPEDCFIEPEIGPCEGICPTYYFNQETNECEEFITGCCGVEAFNTLQECQNICE